MMLLREEGGQQLRLDYWFFRADDFDEAAWNEKYFGSWLSTLKYWSTSLL